MYRLTPIMLQRFRGDLRRFHEMFNGGRCAGWQQEELIVAAIKSDTQAQHHVRWREGGHDDKEDIRVYPNGHEQSIQIKSGKVTRHMLELSGHRHTRFNGDLKKITNYLNSRNADIISVSYEQVNDKAGRRHKYHLRYIDIQHLTGITTGAWEKHGGQYRQETADGVLFKLQPKMSWQVWWSVPLKLAEDTSEIVI